MGILSFDSATRWTANVRATNAEKNINIRSRVDSREGKVEAGEKKHN
jgi:hypothetical protein